MYVLSAGTFVERLLRNLFFLIDDAIFSQIPKLYDLLMAIARTSPLSQANVADIAGRVYKLLAVFMVFKVTFSLIMYIVNPDDFSDKSKGVSKLITNIVISLALLVLTPNIFSYAYQLQKIVLEDNSLSKVVFGDTTDTTKMNLIDAGDRMAYLAISPFVTPNTNQFRKCTNLYSESNDGTITLNKDCFGFEDALTFAKDFDKCADTGDEQLLCGESWKKSEVSELTRKDLANYATGVQNSNYSMFFRKSVVTSRLYVDGEPDFFVFKYTMLISTAVGVIIVLFLITTCMDIGLRSIKLAFLQLIAPIPILSYIDPKSGKDGMFKKWYQLCLKTFLSLFIKLFALYFALYIISKVGRMVDIIDGSYVTNGYIKIFIIIGALMFAKNFTKILESLGIKLDGGFSLRPIKKFEDEALGGKQITGALAGATVGALGGVSLTGRNIARNIRNAKSKKGAVFGALRGVASGFGEVGIENLKGTIGGAIHGEGFVKGWKSQVASNRKMRAAIENGSTWWGRRKENISSLTGMSVAGTFESIGAMIHAYDEEIKKNQNEVKSLELKRDSKKAELKERQQNNELAKKSLTAVKSIAEDKVEHGDGAVGKALEQYRHNVEILKNQIGKVMEYDKVVLDENGRAQYAANGEDLLKQHVREIVKASDVTDMLEQITKLKNDGFMHYIDEVNAGITKDLKLSNNLEIAKGDFKTAFGDVYIEHNKKGDEISRATSAETFSSGEQIKNVLGKIAGEVGRDEEKQREIDSEFYNEIKILNDKNEALEEEKRKAYEAQRAAQANNDVSGTK